MDTAREMLFSLLEEIQRGPFSVSRVCIAAGFNPSVVSRWKGKDIEPKISSLNRLAAAHKELMSTLSSEPGETNRFQVPKGSANLSNLVDQRSEASALDKKDWIGHAAADVLRKDTLHKC